MSLHASRQVLAFRRAAVAPPSGLTALACALAAAFAPAGAQAAQQTVEAGRTVSELRLPETGRHGRDAEWHLIGSNDESEPGGRAESVTLVNRGTVLGGIGAGLVLGTAQLRPAVVLESTGGKGGKGDGLLSASPGGAAGTVRFTNEGGVAEPDRGSASLLPTSLISLTSRGGAGGDAQLSSSSNGRLSPGVGAAGGTAEFSTSQSISTRLATTVVDVLSQGGASGGGGYTSMGQTRPTAVTAGSGGTASATVGAGATLSAAAKGNALSPVSALRVRSQGGGGGRGGDTNGFLTFPTPANHGGAGGKATVTLNGSVETTGTRSVGILVSSVGGAGGRGGDDGAVLDAVPTHGGAGGAGGRASLLVARGGAVTSVADDAPAVFIESRGGAGGDGGIATAFGAVIKVGSSGGAGGSASTTDGASVRFDNEGRIATQGARAVAVTLQSVGGQGGNGTPDGGSTAHGGAGGAGGRVEGVNAGAVTTRGDSAFGIFAQSVGGTGGRGGDGNFLNFGGAAGGNAGAGGSLDIRNTGRIATEGRGAAGLVAQSVGGGDALAAMQVANLTARPTGGGAGGDSSWGFFAARGGSGGSGGKGGEVTVGNTGVISTRGSDAFGMLAQSIGGGGGVAGSAKAGGIGFSVAIGGGGGLGGDGGVVNVSNGAGTGTNQILTRGSGASAVFAQSVGGSGGAAGSASATALGLLETWSLAMGGNGGSGGRGGAVKVDNASGLSTLGANAHGILAQSVGGGGGLGGGAKSQSTVISPPGQPAIAMDYALGGSAGGGGSAGAVTVENRAAISTRAVQSYGIKALSVGGGGGTAGGAETVTNMIGAKLNIGAGFALGGQGGSGGHGGEVRVGNSQRIETRGQFSHGIAAASIGGGGGSGGAASTSTAVGFQQNGMVDEAIKTIALADSVTVDLRLGGQGGGGGNGAKVAVDTRGSVLTHGSNATAVFAQSVGGGGGDAGGFNGGGAGTLSAVLSVGGKGGNGGAGGRVELTTAAGTTIGTRSAGSHALFAQSVGGGGGNGGSFTGEQAGMPDGEMGFLTQLLGELSKYHELTPGIKDAIDQSASAKDTFDAIDQYLKGFDADIVDGRKSDVLERLKKSGFYVSLQAAQRRYKEQIEAVNEKLKGDQASLPNVRLDSSVGGKGGLGGAGGVIDITNGADLTTAGANAYAVLAQSVGGGGGTGGAAYANGTNKINVIQTVGGEGAVAGNGGDVRVGNTGKIQTGGELSFGIFAQSVGGGGGIGGASASADTISLSVNQTIGGNSGKSAAGGKVTVEQAGSVTTQGRQAHAVVAQSVGGGGGTFYVNQATPLEPERFAGDVSQAEREAAARALATARKLFDKLDMPDGGSVKFDNDSTLLPKPALNIQMGGRGGAGGGGGKVEVTHQGGITTHGDMAFGVFGQSIGGGGGFGGNTGKTGYLQATLGMGGGGGTAGDGGDVSLTLANQATIDTHGTGSAAVLLQSIGGGGGYAGSWDLALFTGSGEDAVYNNASSGSSGNGGEIRLAMREGATASIHARGANAHGVVAQSLGGGGGMVADARGLLVEARSTVAQGRTRAVGAGGAIVIESAGSIVAEGADAHAIFAQSGVQRTDVSLDPTRQGGNIRVSHTGVLRGGSGTGAAIVLDGGAVNTITIGAGSTVSAESGTAIRGSFGRETVDNHGTVKGRVDLLGTAPAVLGANHFNNHAGARLSNGGMRLGRGGVLTNHGTMEIGAAGKPAAVEIDGDFVQSDKGTLLVDVSPSADAGALTSDRLTVTGRAQLDGTVRPDVVTALLPGRYTFLEAGNGLEVHADAVAGWPAHVPISWSLQRDGARLALVPEARFAQPAGIALSPNQLATAEHLQRAWDAGTAPQAGTFAQFVGTASAQDYADNLDSLSPENVQAAAVARLHDSRAALRSVLSCPAFVGDGTSLREGECTWGRVGVTRTNQHATHEIQGYRLDSTSYRVGMQKAVRPDWFVGVSAAYTQSRLDGAGGLSRSDGDGVDLAVALKHQAGNWLFAGSLALGHGWFDNRRTVRVGNDVRQAFSDSRVLTAAGRLRAAYQIAGQRWYARPQLDLDVIHTRKRGYVESGAGSLDLEVDPMRDTTFAVRPNLEVGGRIDLRSGGWVRPYGTLGVTLLSDEALESQANFRGSAPQNADFRTSSHMTRVLGDAGLGIQVMSGKGYELVAEYQAQFGRHVVSHQGMARFSLRF